MKEDIEKRLLNLIKNILDIETVTAHDELMDLGFSSMNFVKLGLGIEREFNIEMSEEELDISSNTLTTVRNLVDFIYDKINN